MKKTYYQQAYKCKKKHITTHGVWSNELGTTTHNCHCGETLTAANVVVSKTNQAPGIRTPTKNR